MYTKENIQYYGFRGCVLGQQGMFLDKEKLKKDASNFDIEDFIKNANNLHEHTKVHGPIKF